MPKKKEIYDSGDSLMESVENVFNEEEAEKTSTEEQDLEQPGEDPKDTDEEVVADTDDLEDESKDEPTPSTKIKVGDVEYEPDELNTLLEKGKIARQVEDEQKTDISKLYPEFTKRSQLLKNPEALGRYLKENYGLEVKKPEENLSEEDKAVKDQIKRAREQYGFLTKDDVDSIVSTVLQNVELKELKATVTVAAEKHKLDPKDVIDFMSYLNTRDANMAAEKLAFYKSASTAKAPAPRVQPPVKPDVLKTENKGSGGIKIPPKERPIPHPERDPDGYAKRILEFLEPKSPEEV